MATIDELSDALERFGDELNALPGVVGYAIGAVDGEPGIHLYVSERRSPAATAARARAILAPFRVAIIGSSVPEAEGT